MNVDAKNAEEMARVWRRLSDPFHPDAIKWKPSMVKNNRALAMGYIDARLVMDRLDKVVHPNNWQARYTLLPDGSVECQLSVRVGGEWVTKADVGSQSEQPDGGDRMKAAFSDALKRAAVHWGIGRYLYRLPLQWVDYDPVKKQMVGKPRLPEFAIPKEADEDEADAPEVPEPKPEAKPAPARTGPPAAPHPHIAAPGSAPAKPPADSVARLVQGYATAKSAEDFAGLELRRKELWGGITGAQQATLKADSEATRVRLGLVPAKA